MNILLTNDDGSNSEGINTLFEIISTKHTTFIIAPDEEKSACSSAITIRSPITLKRISENKFTINGYPSDCVNIGLNSDILPSIDLVISGINHGPNLGDDVYFSGTVAGARTALIFGVSGIAISIDCFSKSEYFIDVARFVLTFITECNLHSQENPLLFNINYPDMPEGKISGVRYTTLGRRVYHDYYRIINKSDEEMTLQLDGTIDSIKSDGNDSTELQNGYISITPLTLDCTDYTLLNKIKQMEEPWVK